MDAAREGIGGESGPKHRRGGRPTGPKYTKRLVRLVIDVGTTLWIGVMANDGEAPTKVETFTIVLLKAVRAIL